MLFKSLDIIDEIKDLIMMSNKIFFFKTFLLLDVQKFFALTEKLYSVMPEEVQEARSYLRENELGFEESKIDFYEVLKLFEMDIEERPKFGNFVIIEKGILEIAVERLKENLPPEIVAARKR